ncbi:MAG: hypothetical protein K1Y36_01520 [Blastocatellia bacterium]|nr:hypothetical protein [Blastocatellia bacterium]
MTLFLGLCFFSTIEGAARRQEPTPATQTPIELPPSVKALKGSVLQTAIPSIEKAEYREVVVETVTVWGTKAQTRTHGWVLPEKDQRTGQARVLCWNGVVYPAVSVGVLAKDATPDYGGFRGNGKTLLLYCAELVLPANPVGELDSTKRDAVTFESQDVGRLWRLFEQTGANPESVKPSYAMSESLTVSPTEHVPFQIFLLLQCNHPDFEKLATLHWLLWTGGGPGKDGNPGFNDDPFWLLARDLVWSHYDRMLGWHQQGNPEIVREESQWLLTYAPVLAAEARKRGFTPPNPALLETNPVLAWFPFLDRLSQLAEDNQRRLAAPSRNASVALEKGLQSFPDTQTRTAALIADLEQVAARQESQNGGANLGRDPIIQALLAQGEAAIPQLIATVETDRRLTRSVSFRGEYNRARFMVSVAEAAYFVITKVLKADFGPGYELHYGSAEKRAALIERLKSYWNASAGLSPEFRWYQTLADDNAQPEQWLKACDNILEQPPVRVAGRAGKAHSLPVAGDVLRVKENPSVTDLLVKRITALSAKAAQENDGNLQELACQLTLRLARWDGSGARDMLHQQFVFYRAAFGRNVTVPLSLCLSHLSELAKIRMEVGDTEALREYCEWVRTIQPKQASGRLAQLFAPLWRAPQNPLAVAVLDWMLAGADSPWKPFFVPENLDMERVRLVRTPLLGMASFRREVGNMLARRELAGTVTIEPNDTCQVTARSGWTTTGQWTSSDIRQFKIGTKTEFRVCDEFARELAGLGGAPPIELYWPLLKRNQAVAECVLMLKRYGDRFQFSKTQIQSNLTDPAVMTFPLLEQPATATDVAQGNAIFALPRIAKAKPVLTGQVPLQARWSTLKKFPVIMKSVDEQGNPKTEIQFLRDGTVWQAEEIQVGGKTKRFYGLVGPFGLAKVPAEEIEFPGEGALWSPLSKLWEVNLTPPGKTPNGTFFFVEHPEDALQLTLWLRNRSGLDQTAAFPLATAEAQNTVWLAEGMQLNLSYSAAPLTGDERQYLLLDEKRAWEPVPLRLAASGKNTLEARMVQPGSYTEGFSLDLRQVGDFHRAGIYKLSVAFSGKLLGGATGKSWEMYFQVPEGNKN